MKTRKLFAAFLAAVMSMSLMACGGNETKETAAETSAQTAEETADTG